MRREKPLQPSDPTQFVNLLGDPRLQIAVQLPDLLGALPQFAQQPRVLHRDHRLVGEGLQQLLLGLSDRSGLGPTHHDDAEHIAIAHYRHSQHATPTHGAGKPLIVVWIGKRIGEPDH